MPKTARTSLLTAVIAAVLLTLAAPANASHGRSTGGTGRAVAVGIGWDATPVAAAAPVQTSGIGWD